MGDAINILRKITDSLPQTPLMGNFKISEINNNIQECEEYNLKSGVCRSYSLFSSPFILVERFFIPEGSEIPTTSEGVLYILIYSGIVGKREEKQEKRIGKGDILKIEPGFSHKLIAIEDTWFIAITIPNIKGYPDERSKE